MENRSIGATLLRPNGERVLYAPFVEMDLNKFIKQLKNEVTWELQDHNAITIYKSENATILLRGMHKQCELKERQVNGDITLQVLKGKIRLIIGSDIKILKKGHMICIENKVAHSFVAVKESFFLLTLVAPKV
jgi:quercetin dioxygenase-like cupin family protein